MSIILDKILFFTFLSNLAKNTLTTISDGMNWLTSNRWTVDEKEFSIAIFEHMYYNENGTNVW